MMGITKHNKKFDKTGFVLIKNFLTKSDKKAIFKAFYETASKYLKLGINSSKINFNSTTLHNKLINFRKKKPKEFGDMYDELNLNASLKSVFYSKKFIETFSKILKTKKELLIINGFTLRLDVPFDKRNVLDWHTDAPYYEQTDPHYNAGVCWAALTDNSAENGTVKFIPGSNKSKVNTKKLKFTRRGKQGGAAIKTQVSKKEEKKAKDLDIFFGDIGIFHMNLKHKSGKNISKKMRFTIICRFHDTSKKINIGKEMYIFNKTKTPFLNKNLKYK